MQFLKTLFWVILAVILALFAYNNWQPASVDLGGNARLDTKLPMLVIGAFLVGFLPMWLVHRTVKWRLKRRIATLESANRPPLDISKTDIPPAQTSELSSES